jgi:predicted nicotinamide N-methyase
MVVEKLDIESIKELMVESEPIVISDDLMLIKRLISDIKIETIDDTQTSQMLQANDIIPSVYEGGFKTWECCIDLTRYLIGKDMQGKRVLELGSGTGLPGIFALMRGAHVTFQDFNIQVLRYSTFPNAVLNMDDKVKSDFANGLFEHCVSIGDYNAEFWAGDWKALATEWSEKQFDLILSSETIYDSSSYSSFTKLVDQCLRLGGILLIAAKYQYFGCSGSLHLFLNHLKSNYPSWKISVVMESGAGVRRQVVQVVKE